MIKYLIWLQQILGAGNARAIRIIEHFGGAHNVFLAEKDVLKACGLFTAGELKRYDKATIKDAEDIVSICEKENIEIIPYGNKNYPYCLSVIEDPPLVLYVKGNLPEFDKTPTIAVVGPRKVSDFGKKAAFSLSYRLAKAGFIIVSGGALGTDTYAHAGALKCDGVTVLCMGCGLLSDYLKENSALRDAVKQKGCLISEYPPYTKASKYTFPIRNRIISALAQGTVVIEAGEKSGALITARHANEQGRDVFVIPHSLGEKQFAGSNALLRDGAKAIIDLSDIFGEYITRFPDKINIDKAYDGPILTPKAEVKKEIKEKLQISEKIIQETLSNEAKIVYNKLNKQKFVPEDIKNTGLTSQQLLAALTELEMEFYIKALPGGMYEKC